MNSSKQPAEELSRDQLLAALDAEILNINSAQSVTGRTRWALILSLSALFWLGMQIWENTKYSPSNVAILAITATVIWEFILKVSSSLDASLISSQMPRGRFLMLSNLIGALRSTILFLAAKQAAILAAIIWVGLPELVILKWYSIFGLTLVLLSFCITYIDFPPFPPAEVESRFRVLAIFPLFVNWAVRLTAFGSAVFILWRHFNQFTAGDLRFALIITAFTYLLTLLVKDQFPASHLTALKTIRQNLAFSRLSLKEACDQTDLLLTGGKLVQVFQYHIDSILAAAEQVRASLLNIESLLPHCAKLALEIPESTSAIHDAKRAECDRQFKLIDQLYGRAEVQQKDLLKRLKKFGGHFQFVAFFSPSSVKEADPLIEKLKATIDPIEQHQRKIKSALFAARSNPSAAIAALGMSPHVEPSKPQSK